MPWSCDCCGEDIETVEDGWVEWITLGPTHDTARGFRLVHHETACQYNGRVERERDGGRLADIGLHNIVGPDGLMYLLCLVHEHSIPQAEILEMIKRLHVPDYERARPYLGQARADGIYQPNRPDGFPTPDEIAAIIEEYE